MIESPKPAAKSLLKPQYSLRWIFVEMTLTAVALGCFAYFVNSPHVYQPTDVLFPYLGFFIAAGSAVGGLAHRHIGGAWVGLGFAVGIWPLLLRGLAA